MSFFILEIFFFLSLGAIVFLFVKKLPYVSDIPQKELNAGKLRNSILNSQWVDKLDSRFVDFLSKWLRKMKLAVMRLDNYVSRHIENIKHRTSREKTTQNILKEIESDEKIEKREEGVENKD